MGLPIIDFIFKSLAVSAITRSARGVVALVLRDETMTDKFYSYNTAIDVASADWTAPNLQYIKDAFLGAPNKVIVVRGAAEDLDYNAQIAILGSKKWDWLAIPGIEEADVSTVSGWIIAQRANKKTFKTVLPNSVSDHEGIVNFATAGIVVGENTYTASQYTARIAGILAGLSLTRSATYFKLAEVESIAESEEPGEDIDDGKLILINQDGAIKIGRGVNSLTETTVSKSKVFKKIKIIEGMDLIKSDVSRVFNDEYIGKVLNTYDNQVLFITSINSYLRGLEGEVLDSRGDNTVGVDVLAQRRAWEGIGTDTTDMTDQEIKEKAFESNVFLGGNLKFADAMEDISIEIAV